MPSLGESAARGDLPERTRMLFQQRDVDALAEVYDRYARSVWAVAISVTRADHLAQEAVQDTFLRAWRAAGSYDPRLALGPWLMTIARHAALDLVRREFRPTRGGHEAEQDAVVEDPGIDEAWTAWQVQEALRRLGDDERMIVQLSFFEDLTQTQIAERLGLPLGTVKSRSHRAHRRLAQMLAHLRYEAPDPTAESAPDPAAGPASGSGGRSATESGNRPGSTGRTSTGSTAFEERGRR